MIGENPLRRLLRDWLPQLDFAVLQHGMMDHGRDYRVVVQAAGTYELTFTHVVEMHYRTRVRDDVWPESWDDCFTDYRAWEAAGEPDGYVWGSNWSMAYPGLTVWDDEPTAQGWSERLGKPMYAIVLETDRFWLSLIFHDVRSDKLSDDDSTIRQVIFPSA